MKTPTMKSLKSKKLRELYKYGSALAIIEFSEGVRAISPYYFSVLRMVEFSEFCQLHEPASKQHTHVAFCRTYGLDYTDLFGPGVYVGARDGKPKGLIFGMMNTETQKAFVVDIGEHISLECGCVLARIPDEEVADLINNKKFVCSYTSGHLVDER